MLHDDEDIIAQLVASLSSGAKRVGQGVVDTAQQFDAFSRLVTAENLRKVAQEFGPTGDVKALAVDAPRDFAEGRNVMGTIDLLSAAPGVFGFGGDALRVIGNALRSGLIKTGDFLHSNSRSFQAVGNALDEIVPGMSVSEIRSLDDAMDVAEIRRQIKIQSDTRKFTGLEGPVSASDEVAFLEHRVDELKKGVKAGAPGQTEGIILELAQTNRDLTAATSKQAKELGVFGSIQRADPNAVKGTAIEDEFAQIDAEFDKSLESLGELIKKRVGSGS